MEKKGLMIGDWVQYTQNYYTEKKGIWSEVHYGRVCSVGLLYVKVDWGSVAIEPEVVRPIPLTNEILWKNLPDPEIVFWYPDNNTYRISIGDDVALNIKYVHELQHALRLCGIEKEIEL